MVPRDMGRPIVVLWLLSVSKNTVVSEPSALTYLSEDSFPGLELLEPSGSMLKVYRGGQATDAPLDVVGLGEWKTMPDARKAIARALEFPIQEPYQQDWGLFDCQGTRVTELDVLRNLPVAFIIRLGQWMWPAVRVGFEQEAKGVLAGASLTLKTLSTRPVVFSVEGFILPEEADAVIAIGGKKNMFNSEGVLISADKAAKRAHNDYRTSTQAWLTAQDGSVIRDLDIRTSNLSRIPAKHNEYVQLLRYGEGQFYFSHLDWTDLPLYNGQKDQWRRVHYGHADRLATLFWYLNEVAEGGHTVFPKHGQPVCEPNGRGQRSGCKGSSEPSTKRCDIGLQVKPKKGSVILWYNFHPDGTGDQNSVHGGCPPAEGLAKWSGNKWINTKPFPSSPPKWEPSHPALKRYGWVGEDGLPAEGPANDNSCQLTVGSNLKEDADLFWVNAQTKEEVKMMGLPVTHEGFDLATESTLSSYNGHVFRFKVRDEKTKGFRCSGGKTSVMLTRSEEGLKVVRKKTGDLKKPEL